MYSYVIDFTLAQRGEEAEDYLRDAVGRWPKLWGDIPGVRSTLLLSSALALGGELEYRLRVDIESLATLARADEVIKSGSGGWRRATKEWFAARTVSRAHVSRHVSGDEGYAGPVNDTSGAVHLVLQPQTSGKGLDEQVSRLRSAPGVLSVQGLQPVLAAGGGRDQLWLRLEGLDALDGLDKAAAEELGDARLYGELREVDGALFAGA